MKILLVIDVQQRYLKNYKPDLVKRVNNRISEAVKADIPVVYVRNTGRSGKDENFDLAEDLLIESDCIFKKRLPSAFSNDEFELFLNKMKVETINVVGVDGRCCVSRTVMDALDRGYGVHLLMDAIEAHNDKFYYAELKTMEQKGALACMKLEKM
ncbi:cysteine hydrolase family protein [Pseudobutyrivibrio ruminis]|uniref:cysteine hydrolase family protein n=1 Tax=Pseudobutyrivibrio ruminis TaxID=46206 RepID=UPI00051C88A8|nr:cysteine hydrolase [Pseudobutyrivibrio ruminis]